VANTLPQFYNCNADCATIPYTVQTSPASCGRTPPTRLEPRDDGVGNAVEEIIIYQL